jgi:hypothetical protein
MVHQKVKSDVKPLLVSLLISVAPEHRADDLPAFLAADPFDALYQRRAGGRANH